MFCSNCGKEIPHKEDTLFCPWCGNKIGSNVVVQFERQENRNNGNGAFFSKLFPYRMWIYRLLLFIAFICFSFPCATSAIWSYSVFDLIKPIFDEYFIEGSSGYWSVILIVFSLILVASVLGILICSFFASPSWPQIKRIFYQQAIVPLCFSVLYLIILWIGNYTPAYGLFVSIVLQIGAFIILLPDIRQEVARRK